MPDITISPGSVLPLSPQTVTATGIAGAAINAGQVLWLDTTVQPNQLKLPVATVQAQAAAIVGVALSSTAAALEPVTYAVSGDVIIGGGTMGQVYVVSETAGALAIGTVNSNSYLSVVGENIGNNVLRIALNPVAAKRT